MMNFLHDCKEEISRVTTQEAITLASCYYKGYLAGIAKATSMVNNIIMKPEMAGKGGEKDDR